MDILHIHISNSSSASSSTQLKSLDQSLWNKISWKDRKPSYSQGSVQTAASRKSSICVPCGKGSWAKAAEVHAIPLASSDPAGLQGFLYCLTTTFILWLECFLSTA